MKPTIPSYHYIARNKKEVVCYFDEKSLSFAVKKNNRLIQKYNFQYTEISRIQLSLSDISWHTIDIYFQDKTHIHLKSVTFFVEQNGQLKRPKTNETDIEKVRKNRIAYRNFVVELHQRLMASEATHIRFMHGNPWKKVVIWLLLLALVICISITWKIGSYKLCFVFSTSFLLLFLYSLKINFKKPYSPEAIPQKYLPSDILESLSNKVK